MKIVDWFGNVLYQDDLEDLKASLEKAVKDGANLTRANLDGANLYGANLTRANLTLANLTRANLTRANLDGANLDGANLDVANLDVANLDGANLTRANLYGANLYGANLTRANLTLANLDGANLDVANLDGANLDGGTILETGETFQQYLDEVVPALLTAGGKTVAEVVGSGCWECHSWQNCPMSVAFGVHSLGDIPILFRPRADQFVRLFDNRKIPIPTVPSV